MTVGLQSAQLMCTTTFEAVICDALFRRIFAASFGDKPGKPLIQADRGPMSDRNHRSECEQLQGARPS